LPQISSIKTLKHGIVSFTVHGIRDAAVVAAQVLHKLRNTAKTRLPNLGFCGGLAQRVLEKPSVLRCFTPSLTPLHKWIVLPVSAKAQLANGIPRLSLCKPTFSPQ
jgi:hypothetical protein